MLRRNWLAHAPIYAADQRIFKETENHAHMVALHMMQYNFLRIHKTLRVTPAMAAGVTDKLWKMSDMEKVLKAWGGQSLKLGWAFFALAVISVAAFALNRGVYVGSDVHIESPSYKDMPIWYVKDCKYLFLSGIHTKYADAGITEQQADRGFCPFFHNRD